MEAARNAVKNLTSRAGHHDTTVHEKVAPAVTKETVTKTQEERVTTAVDKEVHQDHYHTSVQPIKDQEILPEQHHHRMGAVEERHFEHNNDSATKERLSSEAAQFRDQTTRVEGQKTTTAQPSVAGEHVHHHVHEVIQPVVNKQTVEPHVVHTTVPIHEVHHNSAQHHATSTLPAVALDEFKNRGGVLEGRGERMDEFEGCPKHSHVDGRTDEKFDSTEHSHGSTIGKKNTNASEWGNETRDRLNGASTTGKNGAALGTTTSTSSTGSKPSLMDKLNPMKDANGDGKKGIMS